MPVDPRPHHVAAAEEALRTEQHRLRSLLTVLGLHAGAGAGSQQDDTGELAALDQHPADTASDTLEREVDLAILHTIEDDLVEVEAALARIRAGTYGQCERCRRAIEVERLLSVPATTRCLEHQLEAEELAVMAAFDAGRTTSDREAAAHLDLVADEERENDEGAPASEEAAMHEESRLR